MRLTYGPRPPSRCTRTPTPTGHIHRWSSSQSPLCKSFPEGHPFMGPEDVRLLRCPKQGGFRVRRQMQVSLLPLPVGRNQVSQVRAHPGPHRIRLGITDGGNPQEGRSGSLVEPNCR
jgi:hypothetical protein